MLEQLLKHTERKLSFTRIIKWIFVLTAIGMSLFHLWTSAFGVMEAWRQRSIHLTFILLIVFLLPNKKEKSDSMRYNLWEIFCLVLLIGVSAYSLIDYENIVFRGGIPNKADQIVAFIYIFLILEATRQKCGWPVVIVAFLFLLYGFFGSIIPGYLGHPRFTIAKICDQIYNSSAGIFGVPLAAAADFIVMFIIFGAFLIHTKGGEYFTQIAFAVAGKYRGGPAKAAVIASAMVGTIHGSGPGNVVTTGSFTIPMMKKVGYEAKFAAGVEAAASTGGIIMPPVMGSAAFIMAAMLGVPYGKIIIYAAIPAILYFASVFWMTHLEAQKIDLQPLDPNDIPNLRATMKRTWPLLLPLALLVYMLISGASASRAALFAILALLALFIFRKKDRITVVSFFRALEEGATGMASISTVCAAAGLIVAMISLTGLGVKLGAVVMLISRGSMLIALILTAFASLILGMGMPGVAAYIIVASTIAPAMIKMGIPDIAAHLFAFYFGQMSAITPPVALSSYAAAAVAGSSLWETGWSGFKMAAAGLIVPFMFVYSPALLISGTAIEIIGAFITAMIGTYALAAGLDGYMGKRLVPKAMRFLLVGAALCLIYQGPVTDIAGVGILVGCFLYCNRPISVEKEVSKQ